MPVVPADEGVHPAARESWVFSGWTGELAVWICFGLDRARRRSCYAAALVGEERSAVLAVEDELPWPRPERYLEVRSRGLWAQHVREQALSHWSCGLEAGALVVDDPIEGLVRGWGHPVGFGLDLEWEAIGGVEEVGDGYRVDAEVHGEVLVGSEVIDVSGHGHWGHRWGDGPDPGGLELVGRLGNDPVAGRSGGGWEGVELPRHGHVGLGREGAGDDGAGGEAVGRDLVGDTEVAVRPRQLAAWRWRGPSGVPEEVALARVGLSSAAASGEGVAWWSRAARDGVS